MDATTEVLRVDVRGVSKRYGAVQALDNVSFQLRPGEVMALLGENGAGKSTLVKVLSGLVVPDSGEIAIDGQVVDIHTSARSQQAGIAVVQQEYSTVGCLSVAENLYIGKSDSPLVWSRRKMQAESRRYLDQVGLEHISASTLVEELSVAEMQLLEIARVLARDAKVVIFDEPTAALSDAEITNVLGVVRRLAAQGISIVYVTHRLPEVFQIADRATVFRNGRSLEPIDVRSSSVPEIVKLMLGRELEDLYPERGASFGDIALELDNLMVPGLRAPISLSARRGEIIGLTGQIGSGAASVVQALAGELPILSGRVVINGQPFERFDRSSGLKNGIAYCSPDRKKDGIFAGTSILRNLSSPWLKSVASAGFVSSRRERGVAEGVAKQFAIDTGRMRSTVGTLSGGNQQKVALSKWLGTSPSILLVEEPTRGVDVGARSDIYARLRALCAEGMTIVVSSSDTSEIYGLCDTIATFYHGQMTALKSHDAWTEEAIVNAVMSQYEAA